MNYVYMIKDEKQNLYIGITNNPERRLGEHNNNRGANFTKDSKTFYIVFLEKHNMLADARKREVQIKKWSRSKKEKLIELYS